MSDPQYEAPAMELEQQAQAFRQATGGGVPATVYIRKERGGFKVAIRMNDGSPSEALAGYLADVLGMTCRNFGMTVKV